MEEIFINALATRSKIEESLIDLLPNDIKLMVEDKLSEFGVKDYSYISNEYIEVDSDEPNISV